METRLLPDPVSTARNEEGHLVFVHDSMTELLARRSFNDSPVEAEPVFHDDPSPIAQRYWMPISPDEIQALLSKTLNPLAQDYQESVAFS